MYELFTVLYWLATLSVGVVLARLFLRTRNAGYIILGVALSVWPILWALPSFFFRAQIDKLVSGEPVLFPFSLVEGRMTVGELVATLNYTGQIIQAGLILVGLLLLSRKTNSVVAEPSNTPLHPTSSAVG